MSVFILEKIIMIYLKIKTAYIGFLGAKIIIAFLLFFIGFLISCNFLQVDEEKNMNAARQAFKRYYFKEDVFQNSNKINAFAGFLYRNLDTIIMLNRHAEYRSINVTDNEKWFRGISNNGDCLSLPTTSPSTLKSYVPDYLLDTLTAHIETVGDDLVTNFTICKKGSRNNLEKENGSLILVLSYEKEPFNDPHYYLHHFIHLNDKYAKPRPEIETITQSLIKDTLLIGNLKYAIRVSPYAGL